MKVTPSYAGGAAELGGLALAGKFLGRATSEDRCEQFHVAVKG
jgi:hypothetical protein